MDTARQVALEFGYSWEAINYCWKYNISAGELLEKLWDLDNGGMEENRFAFPIYGPSKDKTAERKILEEETLLLQFKELCIVCLKKESQVIYLPCRHLLCCENCAQSSCQGCQTDVIQTIRTFRL